MASVVVGNWHVDYSMVGGEIRWVFLCGYEVYDKEKDNESTLQPYLPEIRSIMSRIYALEKLENKFNGTHAFYKRYFEGVDGKERFAVE